MTLSQAAEKLAKRLHDNFPAEHLSVGEAGDHLIVYEHVRGYARLRMANHEFEGFKVVHKYVGRITPLGG